jgi:predicted Ser/Thr protein kinase
VTQNNWERLKALFNGALEQPADARHAWLTEQAGGDEMLAREVAALVIAHETADGFLESPVVVDPAEFTGVEEPGGGTRLGSYEIEFEIGRGGMGIVYCARDSRLGRRVALKALPPVHHANAGLRERLRREARAAATISHPSVATVYALEEIDGNLFIASEYVEGHTLRSEIDRGLLDRRRALSIAADIARALAAAHSAGVVHRDLKPENVLITQTGAVKVVDFGIAHHIDSVNTRLTRPGEAVGTPAYMPPEQMLNGATDVRADIFALGVVLSEMLTGRHPLAPGRRAMPGPGAEIASRCIQVDPNDRYQSARELAEAIESEMQQPFAAHTWTPGPPSTRWWWEFHQAAVASVYAAMVWPMWIARSVIGGREGNAVFVAVLASAIVAVTLRLHLWFTSRFYPAELGWARARALVWVLASDVVFAMALVVAGALVGDASPALAVLAIGVGIAAVSAFALVEPATTRAAFRATDKAVDSSRP